MIARDQRGDLPEERPLASDTKATSIYLEGVQKPHRSKALCATEGPVYYRKDFRLHSSLSLREGNTSFFLEQDVILPSNWRFLSGMNSLWCCLHWGLFLALGATCGLSLTLSTWAPVTHRSIYPLWVPFTETFMDRTEQCLQSTLLSKYAYQQSQNYWRDGPAASLAVAACSVGRLALLSRDKIAWGPQGENPSLTASLQMSGTFSGMWLCDDHIVSLQTPKTKIREGPGEQKDNWEDTFYTLLWVLQ